MKYNTFKRYDFTADLWKFTTQTGPDATPILTYSYSRPVTVFATTSQLGKMTVFFKVEDNDILVKHQLYNFRDAGGNEIIANGVFQIIDVQAQLNIWGVRSGTKCRADFIGFDA